MRKIKKTCIINSFRRDALSITIQDVVDFHTNLEKFPVLSYNNWNNLIIYAQSIFNKSESSQILKFNKNLDLLYELSKTFSKKQSEPNNEYENMILGEFDEEDQ